MWERGSSYGNVGEYIYRRRWMRVGVSYGVEQTKFEKRRSRIQDGAMEVNLR